MLPYTQSTTLCAFSSEISLCCGVISVLSQPTECLILNQSTPAQIHHRIRQDNILSRHDQTRLVIESPFSRSPLLMCLDTMPQSYTESSFVQEIDSKPCWGYNKPASSRRLTASHPTLARGLKYVPFRLFCIQPTIQLVSFIWKRGAYGMGTSFIGPSHETGRDNFQCLNWNYGRYMAIILCLSDSVWTQTHKISANNLFRS